MDTMERVEVRSVKGNSYPGHVFKDGSGYCINSVALRFIPKGQLEIKGFGRYLKLF
ncbi:MAG: peptide-methionine (R)-S-oxide reductase [Candidatus Omnitrophica bacterium]|nr:peptide-methionine (R)-S-oxide reductase [Candidatus Omnitrophota bacterium]